MILVEERSQALVVFGVAGDDAVAGQRPVVFLANGDDLTRIARAEIVERVVARDTCYAGDEHGERERFVGAGDHGTDCTRNRLQEVSKPGLAPRRLIGSAGTR